MSLTSYRAAPPRVRWCSGCSGCGPEAVVPVRSRVESLPVLRAAPPRLGPRRRLRSGFASFERYAVLLARFGGDLLSRVLRRSTIGATALNGRVRNGAGCFARAMTTKPRKKHNQRCRGGVSGSLFGAAACLSRGQVTFCVYLLWSFEVLLLLDQIKPIGQLVPVS